MQEIRRRFRYSLLRGRYRKSLVSVITDQHYCCSQCRITNVGDLVQNFSGGLFSRRMVAPVSQTNAAKGSVQYSWGSGGRCKPV